MSKPESPPRDTLLDLDSETRTGLERGVSDAETPDSDSADSETEQNWNRQQKRVFHRVLTLLSYWEQHEYEILWLTLTSSPESDPASELSYNHRRLRQTVERARLAYDGDGEAHDLSHVRSIESLVIRTSEGPPGKGVLHLFWAWKPPKGQHSREFYVPHKWLCAQWGRIHGPYDERAKPEVAAYDEPGAVPEIEPLHCWVEKVGEENYHSRENLAGYCVSQYLGEHGEALEHVSWSWERSLGGSVTETWEAIKALTGSMSEAVEAWHTVLGGEELVLTSPSEHVRFEQSVKPPPNLGVSEERNLVVEPPEDYERSGPQQSIIRRTTRRYPEHDGGVECPVCEQATIFDRSKEPDYDGAGEVRYVCMSCRREFVDLGEGEPEVFEIDCSEWEPPEPSELTRQTRLWEFAEEWVPQWESPRREQSEASESGRSSDRPIIGRDRSHDPAELEPGPEFPEEAICRYVRANVQVSVVEVMGRFGLSPECRERVVKVFENLL